MVHVKALVGGREGGFCTALGMNLVMNPMLPLTSMQSVLVSCLHAVCYTAGVCSRKRTNNTHAETRQAFEIASFAGIDAPL